MQRSKSDTALQHSVDAPPANLDKLPFTARWDYVGLPSPSGHFPSPPAHPLVAHPFSRIAASSRLSPLDEEDGLRRLRGGALTLEEQVARVSPKGCTKRQASFFRDRQVEAGSSIRFLEKSASASAIPERLLPADHLDKVTRGLEDLAGPQGPSALTQKRLAEKRSVQSGETTRRPNARASIAVPAGFSSSASPTGNRQPRRTIRGRLVAVSEFSLWCSQKFGSTEAAWEAICGLNADSAACPTDIEVEDFASSLTKHGFPMGDLAARNVFLILDSDDDGVVSLADVDAAIGSVAIGKTVHASPPPSQEKHVMSAKDMDPFESIALQGQGSESSLEKARAKVLERLHQEDPPVGQFMEQLFSSFKTLRMAFRQMDLNANGSLTYSEFVYSMQTMRDNKGVKFIEAHIANLFDRLDINHTGCIRIDALMRAFDKEEGTDPMIYRLGVFLSGEASEDSGGYCLEISGHAARREKLKVAFKKEYHGVQKPGDEGGITQQEFLNVLIRMRYPEWHINELFGRLDKDTSGALSVGEFTAFLVKDVVGGKPKPKPVVPLGSEERRKGLEGGHTTAANSPKLAQCGIRASGGGKFEMSGPLQTSWRPAETTGLSLRCERPDYLTMVHEGLRLHEKTHRRSEVQMSGKHVFSGNPQKGHDLVQAKCALHHFDESASRTTMDAS